MTDFKQSDNFPDFELWSGYGVIEAQLNAQNLIDYFLSQGLNVIIQLIINFKFNNLKIRLQFAD